jgi:hypothetical protein
MFFASAHSKHFAFISIMSLVAWLGCQGKSRSWTGRDGSTVDVQPSIPLFFDLEGKVTDKKNIALPDVLVLAWPKGKHGQGVVQTRTDQNGHFLLPKIQSGRWMFLVEAGGLGTQETERQVPDDHPTVLALENDSRTISGHVTDGAGRPQANADVVLGSPALRWPRMAKSDLNGTFIVTGLGYGRYTIRASMGSLVSVPSALLVEETTFKPSQVRLALEPGVFIEGHVRDDKGRSLADATIDVMSLPSDDMPISGKSTDGRYRVGPIAPGRYQVQARLEDYILLEVTELQVGGRPSTSVDLRLVKTARVSGRVLDEDGSPIIGIPVFSISLLGGNDDLVVVPGALPSAAEAAELPVGKLIRPGGVRSSQTDKAGCFSMAGISPGRIRMEVVHPQKLPYRKDPLLLVPGENRELGDLTLVSGAILAGKAMDEQGSVVPGVIVEARQSGKLGRQALRATTDVRGEFFMRVPSGEYSVNAWTNLLSTTAALQVQVQNKIPADMHLIRLSAKQNGGFRK